MDKKLNERTRKGTLHSVRWHTVLMAESQQRIDNFLLRILKGVPRPNIYRILRRGEVRVNSGRVRQTYRLQTGDRVRIPLLWIESGTMAAPPPPEFGLNLLQRVLYEDDALLIIDKPAGIAVHGGSNIAYGIIERLRSVSPQWEQIELAHRLDRETSGCLMLAKRRSALRQLHQHLREQRIEKHYQVLVKGHWKQRQPVLIQQPLLKKENRNGERYVRVAKDGKPSATQITAIAVGATASLLDAQPLTGKTHQIRVHLANSGYPIAGDKKYGDSEFNRYLRARGLSRLFLHACQLKLLHPLTSESLLVSAPLPVSLVKVAKKLGIPHTESVPYGKSSEV